VSISVCLEALAEVCLEATGGDLHDALLAMEELRVNPEMYRRDDLRVRYRQQPEKVRRVLNCLAVAEWKPAS
jgi:hypothetical protein